MRTNVTGLVIVVACLALTVGFLVAGGLETTYKIKKSREQNKRVKETISVANRVATAIEHVRTPPKYASRSYETHKQIGHSLIVSLEKYHLVPYRFSPPGSVDGKGLLEDVLSRSKRPDYFRKKYADDLGTMCHEATHDVNNRIRNATAWKRNAFYLGEGVAIFLEEPKVTLATVARYVKPEYRDKQYYQLYLVEQQKDWNEQPLYIFDEWTAYCNGAQASKELGIKDTGDLQGAKQFCHYAECVVEAVEREDETYLGGLDLREFVAWQKERVRKLCE